MLHYQRHRELIPNFSDVNIYDSINSSNDIVWQYYASGVSRCSTILHLPPTSAIGQDRAKQRNKGTPFTNLRMLQSFLPPKYQVQPLYGGLQRIHILPPLTSIKFLGLMSHLFFNIVSASGHSTRVIHSDINISSLSAFVHAASKTWNNVQTGSHSAFKTQYPPFSSF